MRVMGVDPSITRTGIGLPDRTTFTVSPPKSCTGDARLTYHADHVGLAARTARVDLVVMEDAPTTLQGNALRVLLHLQGALRLELMRNHITYMILSPSTLKKFATGNGGASKDLMAQVARQRLGRVFPTDDECDAHWLRIAGRMAYGHGELISSGFLMPGVHLDALRWAGTGRKRHEIVWPEIGGRAPWPEVALRA